MNDEEIKEKISIELDRLRQLIKNIKEKGQFTVAKKYEEYLKESEKKFKKRFG